MLQVERFKWTFSLLILNSFLSSGSKCQVSKWDQVRTSTQLSNKGTSRILKFSVMRCVENWRIGFKFTFVLSVLDILNSIVVIFDDLKNSRSPSEQPMTVGYMEEESEVDVDVTGTGNLSPVGYGTMRTPKKSPSKSPKKTSRRKESPSCWKKNTPRKRRFVTDF
jgi:hypothetical protein